MADKRIKHRASLPRKSFNPNRNNVRLNHYLICKFLLAIRENIETKQLINFKQSILINQTTKQLPSIHLTNQKEGFQSTDHLVSPTKQIQCKTKEMLGESTFFQYVFKQYSQTNPIKNKGVAW